MLAIHGELGIDTYDALVEAARAGKLRGMKGVGARTEARIAERVARLRRGCTTIVCTVSPLWLHHADRVVVLADDRVVADGDHDDLLVRDPTYRAVVARVMDEEVTT